MILVLCLNAVDTDFNTVEVTVFFPAGTVAEDGMNDRQCFTISAGSFGDPDIINDSIFEFAEDVQLEASSNDVVIDLAILRIIDNDSKFYKIKCKSIYKHQKRLRWGL